MRKEIYSFAVFVVLFHVPSLIGHRFQDDPRGKNMHLGHMRSEEVSRFWLEQIVGIISGVAAILISGVSVLALIYRTLFGKR